MNTRIVNIDLDKNNIINLDVNLMLYRLAVLLAPFREGETGIRFLSNF